MGLGTIAGRIYFACILVFGKVPSYDRYYFQYVLMILVNSETADNSRAVILYADDVL